MQNIVPDAPYIREAETVGYGEECPICPICGQYCEEIYYTKVRSDPIACDRCLISRNAWEWQEEKKENEQE